MPLTIGSLFSGIGGFDLGFERAGFKIKWQVEIDPYCLSVLAKHWPKVSRFTDVRLLDHRTLAPVDVLVGGFPYQDVSHAGPRIGIQGQRSGLWREIPRLIRVLAPRYVVVENVTGLTDRGLDVVLGDLAALGFDAEWSVLSGCALGAPHTRERVFVVAYSQSERSGQLWREQCTAHSTPQRHVHWTESEPPSQRVVDGVPERLERLTALGNAVIPQVAQWIAERIKDVEQKLAAGEIATP